MEHIFEKSNLLIRNIKQKWIRFAMDTIDWHNHLIGILGARGTGKTTMLYNMQDSILARAKVLLIPS